MHTPNARPVRREVQALFAILLVLLTVSVGTAQPAAAGPNFTVALNGYDAVAYFSDGRPTPGSVRFIHFWNGTNWLFSSNENRLAFVANPEKYAPAYDGYCAFAAARGYIAPGNPDHWKIVDGRLFLNVSARAQELWEQSIPEHIRQGDQNWSRINGH